MTKQLVLEKQKQAAEILNEKGIDLWLNFVRETGNIKDPMLDMLVGTGATWQSAFIITKEGDTVAVIGSLEKGNMEQVGTFKEIITYVQNVREDLQKILKRFDPKKIAINFSRNSTLADGLTYGLYLELIDHLKETPYVDRLVSSEDVVAALRGRKSDTELALMKEAIKETLRIFDEVTGFIQPGKTEIDVANFVRSKVAERGYGFAWDEEHCPAVYSGPGTAGAHAAATDRKIEKGHVINMDFGLNINGYCSDLQRTWYVLRDAEENAPEEVLKGFNVIKDSIQLAAKAIIPGKMGCEIDDVARNYIVENGYEEFSHGLGHQLGRVAHDGGALFAPRWERYKNLPFIPIEEGNVFTIEPRLPIEGYGIATIEEEVVVRENGVEFLSNPQTEIYLIK
ncbi:MAG: Xaa-Pro peptidase family protein [Melioribacteraceae bacterium]|nr:Xaa-Pro peptidase family protein [Melioribacteraceae bacterium]MCF8263008.1 Xaa-Pro peptidase family protein [Melioribacteraceae bacterium]MCF8430453.1 Xaa-Pro peptidase family protein [Melioribacteraceae bacterium]